MKWSPPGKKIGSGCNLQFTEGEKHTRPGRKGNNIKKKRDLNTGTLRRGVLKK